LQTIKRTRDRETRERKANKRRTDQSNEEM
jgi:hypothetical protein